MTNTCRMAAAGVTFVPPVFAEHKRTNNFFATEELDAKLLKHRDNSVSLAEEAAMKVSLKDGEDTICFRRESGQNLTMNCSLPKLTIVTGKNPKSNLSISVNEAGTKYTSSNPMQTFANNNNSSFLDVVLHDKYNKYKAVEKSTTKLKANSKVYTAEKELNLEADRVTLTAPKGVEVKDGEACGDKVAFLHDDDTLKINPYKHYFHGIEASPLRIDEHGNVRIDEKKFFYDHASGYLGLNNDEPKFQLDVVGTIHASTSVIASKLVSDRDVLTLQAPKSVYVDSKHVRMTGDLSVDLIDHAVFNDKVLVLNRTAPDADRSDVYPSQTADGAGIFVNANFKALPDGMSAADWQQAFKWYYRGGLFQEVEDEDSGRLYTDVVPGHLRSSWVLSGGNFTIQGGSNQASFMLAIEDDTLNMYKLKKSPDGTETFVELCGTFG